MRFHTHGSIDAAVESPIFTERGDLGATIFEPRKPGLWADCTVHITGTPAERRAFLVALAEAAVRAAGEIEDVPEPALVEVSA